MIYAIISDIHSNLEALRAVLEDARECDHILCIGDLVGYGANPNESVDLIAEHCTPIANAGLPVVMGNHDYAAVTGDTERFNPAAIAATRWTQCELSRKHAKFLKSLRYDFVLGEMLFVHGSPFEPEKWNYVLKMESARSAFLSFPEGTKACFIGHSHRQMFLSQDSADRITALEGAAVTLESDKHYLINVGSVGQPRDNDPRACYATYNTEASVVQLHRVEYDVEKAARAILAADLPEQLAKRLFEGT